MIPIAFTELTVITSIGIDVGFFPTTPFTGQDKRGFGVYFGTNTVVTILIDVHVTVIFRDG